MLESCTSVLGNLAEDEDAVLVLVKHAALRPLIALLVCGTKLDEHGNGRAPLARIQTTRTSQLSNIKLDLDNQVMIKDNKATAGRRESNQLLKERRESSQVQVKSGGTYEHDGQGHGLGVVENTALALAEFATHDQIVPQMVAEGVVSPLLYLCLHSESLQVNA